MRHFEIRKISLLTAVSLAAGCLQFPAYAVTVEKDEFGVAYVLKEDGTKDYNNIPVQPSDDGNSISTGTIIDTNRHELSTNGPTKDQSTVGIPDGMSKDTYNALSDSVINWSEIPNLVEYRNPTYTKYYRQADDSVATMQSAYDEFRSQMHEQIDSLDTTISGLRESEKLISSVPGNSVSMNGTTISKDSALASLDAGLATAISGKNTITNAITTTRNSLYYATDKVDNALKPVRNQLISTVETLIISYKTLETNRSLVAEQVALYEELYKMQADLEAQSMSTRATTAGYLNRLNTAKKTLAELDAGMQKLKKNILLQCGYDASADVSIGDIPDPDKNFLDGRNYEEDKKTAVDGNSAVISAGKLGNYAYSSEGMKSRDLGENEARGKASAAMDALYNEVKKQIILSDSAQTSLRKAELAEKAAELKYGMGMVSAAEYASLKMQYLSYTASAEQNRLNLIQAIENYKWAVDGIMSIS